ncbi:uncharacterized protein LOC132945773 [Metopolophium dirhodum]|uniref:uncharacterized protein LOC132945773 n=1 Tax=Metopolophium dirhodum TaxID=44670 RepID=UPI00298F54E0|nr:uncharacterized protein LOC132945773 [Metopolophium dirhodum]
MNCLSIVLVIAFVSYSLGAPENIESQSGENHGLGYSSDQGLDDEYEDGNVNGDPSTSDPSPITNFGGYRKIKGKKRVFKPKFPRRQSRQEICAATCVGDCVSGWETSACLKCMGSCLVK